MHARSEHEADASASERQAHVIGGGSNMRSASLVILVALASYLPTLWSCEFVFDDVEAISNNMDVHGRTSLLSLLWNDFWGVPINDPSSHGSYRPLTVLTFRLDNWFASVIAHYWSSESQGSAPHWPHSPSEHCQLPFRLTNWLLHAAMSTATLILCRVVLRDDIPCDAVPAGPTAGPRGSLPSRRYADALINVEASALLAALLFAVHPVHTEAVASLVGRAEILAGLAFIGVLFAHRCAALARTFRTLVPWLVLTVVLAMLGMLCKEQAATALPVVAILDMREVCVYWWSCRLQRRSQEQQQQQQREGQQQQREEQENQTCVASNTSTHTKLDKLKGVVAEHETLRIPACCRATTLVVATAALLWARAALSARIDLSGRRCGGDGSGGGGSAADFQCADTGGVFGRWLDLGSGGHERFNRHQNPIIFMDDWTTRWLTIAHVQAINVGLLLELWPAHNLCHDWSMDAIPPVESVYDGRNLCTLLAVVAVAGGLLAVARFTATSSPSQHQNVRGSPTLPLLLRVPRSVVLGVLMLSLPYLPASHLLLSVGFVVAERTLYVPSVGLAVLVAAVMQCWSSRSDIDDVNENDKNCHMSHNGADPSMLTGTAMGDDDAADDPIPYTAPLPLYRTIGSGKISLLALALVSAAASRCFERTMKWQSGEALYRSAIESGSSCSTNARSHFNLAYITALRAQQPGLPPTAVETAAGDAEKHYSAAVGLSPTFSEARINLGTLLELHWGTHRTAEARAQYEAVLRVPLGANGHVHAYRSTAFYTQSPKSGDSSADNVDAVAVSTATAGGLWHAGAHFNLGKMAEQALYRRFRATAEVEGGEAVVMSAYNRKPQLGEYVQAARPAVDHYIGSLTLQPAYTEAATNLATIAIDARAEGLMPDNMVGISGDERWLWNVWADAKIRLRQALHLTLGTSAASIAVRSCGAATPRQCELEARTRAQKKLKTARLAAAASLTTVLDRALWRPQFNLAVMLDYDGNQTAASDAYLLAHALCVGTSEMIEESDADADGHTSGSQWCTQAAATDMLLRRARLWAKLAEAESATTSATDTKAEAIAAAVEAYRTVPSLTAEPLNVHAAAELGALLLAAPGGDRVAEALVVLDDAISESSSANNEAVAELHTRRGLALMRLGRAAAAALAQHQAIRMAPTLWTPHFNFALALSIVKVGDLRLVAKAASPSEPFTKADSIVALATTALNTAMTLEPLCSQQARAVLAAVEENVEAQTKTLQLAGRKVGVPYRFPPTVLPSSAPSPPPSPRPLRSQPKSPRAFLSTNSSVADQHVKDTTGGFHVFLPVTVDNAEHILRLAVGAHVVKSLAISACSSNIGDENIDALMLRSEELDTALRNASLATAEFCASHKLAAASCTSLYTAMSAHVHQKLRPRILSASSRHCAGWRNAGQLKLQVVSGMSQSSSTPVTFAQPRPGSAHLYGTTIHVSIGAQTAAATQRFCLLADDQRGTVWCGVISERGFDFVLNPGILVGAHVLRLHEEAASGTLRQRPVAAVFFTVLAPTMSLHAQPRAAPANDSIGIDLIVNVSNIDASSAFASSAAASSGNGGVPAARIVVIVERVDGRTWCHDGSAVQLSVGSGASQTVRSPKVDAAVVSLYLPTDAVLATVSAQAQRIHLSATLLLPAHPQQCARGSDSGYNVRIEALLLSRSGSMLARSSRTEARVEGIRNPSMPPNSEIVGMAPGPAAAAASAALGIANAAWLKTLSLHEWGVYSQNGEDGVLRAIFAQIGALHCANRNGSGNRQDDNHSATRIECEGEGAAGDGGFYVEFGVEDGSECNTRLLREHRGWHGLLMDGGHENSTIGLSREWITAESIIELFRKHGVPHDFDLLSIDIDRNDYWVLKALLEGTGAGTASYRPRVIVAEINSHIPVREARTVAYDANAQWDGTTYGGASLLAMTKLLEHHHFSLVYCESHGVNCFFVRSDILGLDGGASPSAQLRTFDKYFATYHLHKPPNFFGEGRRHPEPRQQTGLEWVWV